MSAPSPDPNPLLAFPAPFTFTYQRLGDVDYPLDVYLPETTRSSPIPALVYWHGGGLVMGNRSINTWAPKGVFADALKAGIALICPTYTFLSPHSGLDVVADIRNCFKWIGTNLNTEIAKYATLQIDTTRLAVSGSSAGGWMAYLSGSYAVPKPKAIISIYGMAGNLLTPMYLEPKTKPFFWLTPNLLSDAEFLSYFHTPSTSRLTSTSLDDPRLDYYTWLQQKALFIDVLTAIPGLTATLVSLPPSSRPSAIPTSVLHLFPNLNVTPDFPPTFFVHGTDDEAVPIEESREMFRVCKEVRVEECRMLEVQGGNHDLDYEKESWEVEGLAAVVPWLLERLR